MISLEIFKYKEHSIFLLVTCLGFDRRSHFDGIPVAVAFYPVIQFSAALLPFCQTPASQAPRPRASGRAAGRGQGDRTRSPALLCALFIMENPVVLSEGRGNRGLGNRKTSCLSFSGEIMLQSRLAHPAEPRPEEAQSQRVAGRLPNWCVRVSPRLSKLARGGGTK